MWVVLSRKRYIMGMTKEKIHDGKEEYRKARPDGFQGDWIEIFDECHARIAALVNSFFNDDQVMPECLIMGRIVPYLRNILKGNTLIPT